MRCAVCLCEFEKLTNSKFPVNICSDKCYYSWSKNYKTPNCKCVICGTPMYIKPYRIARNKNGITCSRKCANLNKSTFMEGVNNYQFGAIGVSSKIYKGKYLKTSKGYILEHVDNHPNPHDAHLKTCRVFQHRLVVEANYQLFPEFCFFVLDGKHYLKSMFDVHHINEVKDDNRVENLQVVLRDQHTKMHNSRRRIIRNEHGRIIGVIKRGELLGSPEVGNQQPSLVSNDLEGSTTNGRHQLGE